MRTIKYRVVLKVGYYESWFEFEEAKDATKFATEALQHMVSTEDTKKTGSIIMQIVDTKEENEEVE